VSRRLIAWIAGGLAIVVLATVAVAAVLRDADDDSEEPAASGKNLGLLADGRLLVGIAIPFPPFLTGEPPKLAGYEVEVVEAVAEELGLTVKFSDVSFESLLGDLSAGKFDLAAPATTITLPLEESVDFADPDYEEQLALLVTEDSDVGGIADLDEKNVGVRRATTSEAYANEETSAAKVSGFAEDADAVSAVESGKVDAAILDQPVAQAAVDADLGVEVAALIPTGAFYALALPEKKDSLREAVNSALAELKDDGTIDRLYERYFGIEAPGSVLSATNEPR